MTKEIGRIFTLGCDLMDTACVAWLLARMTSSGSREEQRAGRAADFNERDGREEKMFANICAPSHIWVVSQEGN